MKFESVISETKAKREQVWLAYDYNGDQLQLEAKWLDDGIRRLPADDVFLIRVVSICDGCPILLTQAFDSIRHVYLRVITICMLSIITHETRPPPTPSPSVSMQVKTTDDFRVSRLDTWLYRSVLWQRWRWTFSSWLILHPNVMCWTGLEKDMWCKMGLISRAYWFPLRCSWIWLLAIIPAQQTMMDGWWISFSV